MDKNTSFKVDNDVELTGADLCTMFGKGQNQKEIQNLYLNLRSIGLNIEAQDEE